MNVLEMQNLMTRPLPEDIPPRLSVGVKPCHGSGCLLKSLTLSRDLRLSIQDFQVHGTGPARILRDAIQAPMISFYTCLSGVARILCARAQSPARIRLSNAELRGYNPNVSMEILRDHPIRIFTISLEPDLFYELTGKTVHDLLKILQQVDFNAGKKAFPRPLERVDFALRLSAAQVLEASGTSRPDTLFLKAKALEFLSLHLKQLAHLAGNRPCQKRATPSPDRIAQACEILKKEMADPPGARQLARRVGINHNQLVKGFKENLGVMPFEYLRAMRLEHAHDLLSGRQCNVTQAALHVGYSSLSHFTKAFRDKFGIPPKACTPKG